MSQCSPTTSGSDSISQQQHALSVIKTSPYPCHSLLTSAYKTHLPLNTTTLVFFVQTEYEGHEDMMTSLRSRRWHFPQASSSDTESCSDQGSRYCTVQQWVYITQYNTVLCSDDVRGLKSHSYAELLHSKVSNELQISLFVLALT